MVARVATVAFSGIDTLPVDAQVTIASGLPGFQKVCLLPHAPPYSPCALRRRRRVAYR
jgi:hypothetical protein